MKYFSTVTARGLLSLVLMSFLALGIGCSGDASKDNAGRDMSTDGIVLSLNEISDTAETAVANPVPNSKPLEEPLGDLLEQIEAGASMVTQEPYHTYLVNLADTVRGYMDLDQLSLVSRLLNLMGADGVDLNTAGDSSAMTQFIAYIESLAGSFSSMEDLGRISSYGGDISGLNAKLNALLGQVGFMEEAEVDLDNLLNAKIFGVSFGDFLTDDIYNAIMGVKDSNGAIIEEGLIDILSGDISTDDLPDMLYADIIPLCADYANTLRTAGGTYNEWIAGMIDGNGGLIDQLYSIGSLTATFAPPDAKLEKLEVSSGTISPFFLADVEDYTLEVASDVAAIAVTPKTSADGATVTVDGVAVTSGSASQAIALEPGVEKTITLVVTAEDGNTTLNYRIKAKRLAGTSTNANLADLTVSNGDIVPSPFDPLIIGYDVELFDPYITLYVIRPTVAGVGATITVNGTPVVSGTDSQAIDLLEDFYNVIVVQVTAGDGVTKKSYTVTVYRPEIPGEGE